MTDCEKCKGKGMLPLKNKKGEIIPHAWVYCEECYEEEPDHFYPLQPRDIDFPISYSYYRGLCQLHGWPDPGPCEPPEHSREELHERIAALEDAQSSEKLQLEVKQPYKKPKPKLANGNGVEL